MTDELDQENINEEKTEASSEEVPGETLEREAEAPRVLEIHPPAPFDDEALSPFVDIYMQKRGLTDRKQAAVKLGNVLWRMGYNPRRDIQNVRTYIQNLSSVLEALPDTAETVGVKGAVAASGAVVSANMLRKTHFGERDEIEEMKELVRYANRARATTRLLDKIYETGDDMNRGENDRIKRLEERLDRNEKRSEFEGLLAPIKQQLQTMQESIKDLKTKPGTAEVSPEVKKLEETVNGLVKNLEKRNEQDAFAASMDKLREDFKDLGEKLSKSGGAPKDVEDVFDRAVNAFEKIGGLLKKYGGAGFEGGEIDWRAALISTVGEIGTETVKAAREIYSSGRGRGEEEEIEKRKEAPGKITEEIIDRRLLGYIQDRAITGATVIQAEEAAEKLGLTFDQIKASHKRLQDKGLVRGGDQGGGGKGKEPTQSDIERWVAPG